MTRRSSFHVRDCASAIVVLWVLGCVVTALNPFAWAQAAEIHLTVSFRAAEDEDFYREVLDRFEAENPGVTLEILPNMSPTRLLVAIAGGLSPDIANVDWGAFYRFVRAGVVLPLDRYMEETKWGRALSTKMTPQALAQSSVLGHQYGIPLAAGANVPVYNPVLFASRGLGAPPEQWTWDEVAEIARRLTDPVNGIYGLADVTNNVIWEPLYDSHGGSWWNETQTRFTFASPPGLRTLEQIQDLAVLRQVSNPGNASKEFIAGRTGIAMANTSWPRELDQAEAPWDFAPTPMGDVRQSIRGGNHPIMIMASTRHPDLAWRVIETLTGDEAQLAIANRGLRLPANLSVVPRIEDPVFRRYAEYLVYQMAPPTKFFNEIYEIIQDHIGKMVAQQLSPQAAVEEIQRLGEALVSEMDAQDRR